MKISPPFFGPPFSAPVAANNARCTNCCSLIADLIAKRRCSVFPRIARLSRLFQTTKPYAATSMHHLVNHLITRGNVDQVTHTTTGWSTNMYIDNL